MTFKVPEQYRIEHPLFAGGDEENGAFSIRVSKNISVLVIASKGEGWEHVSVSSEYKGKPLTPSWDIMCAMKDLFWTDDETVIQYHPCKSDYVNFHPNCLHMWKKINEKVELPPTYMVGPEKKQDECDCKNTIQQAHSDVCMDCGKGAFI